MARIIALVALFLSSIVLADAQALKGTAAAAASQAEAEVETPKGAEAVTVADVSATELTELPKQHPPTTSQAIEAFALIILIPAIGIFCMMKGKDAGWEGAFGVICCLIFLVWVYTAVEAL
eukprot:TRINITY_DN5726_c0_g1_i1.p3 TRINITY_DN5726_c0_g1~~TRINITY_DN5726_c0_g1_i1.p3  ORF type:complete len:121 (-),score=38.65 TRINITY_DN5726_c0_g1_i1:83-445(-)